MYLFCKQLLYFKHLANSCSFKQCLSALLVFFELLFIYSCVCVYFRCFYISLLMMALDEILVKIPVCLGTRQFFELLEDSVGMTSCLVFLPHLYYGFPVGFSVLFIIFQAPSAWWPSSFLFRLLKLVGWQLRWLATLFNGCQSSKKLLAILRA